MVNTDVEAGVNRLTVRPAEIEKTLEKLRTSGSATGRKAGEPPAPRMRAVLANIIVLVHESGAFGNEANLDSLITRLAASHPSRFFIVRIAEGDKPISAEVCSRQVVPDSGAHLFSEEIYINVGGPAMHFVPNLLLSLFIADVDVVLVVPEPIVAEQEIALIRDLRKLSRLVLFDSSFCQSYGHDVRRLLEQCASVDEAPRDDYLPQLKRFSDISWRRTRRWRSLLSECFDSDRLMGTKSRVSRIKLFSCREVQELHKGALSSDTYLMAGWCAACLNSDLTQAWWQKTKRGVMLNAPQPGDEGLVQLEFISWNDSTIPERSRNAERDLSFGLSSIELVLHPAADAVRLKISRLFDRNAAEILLGATSSQQTGTCEFSVRYAPFSSQAIGELVFRDILSNRGEDVYRKSLENSLRIADVLEEPDAPAA